MNNLEFIRETRRKLKKVTQEVTSLEKELLYWKEAEGRQEELQKMPYSIPIDKAQQALSYAKETKLLLEQLLTQSLEASSNA